MAKNKDQVNDAAWSLSKSVQEANQAITDSAVAAQERNVKVSKHRPGQSTRPRKSIFIPSTMTVATLAKVMNMKLGEHL